MLPNASAWKHGANIKIVEENESVSFSCCSIIYSNCFHLHVCEFSKYHEFCPTITHSVCSNLFVAFICDPLDLDLFPPHVSAVAVGGANKGAWSRLKMIKDFSPLWNVWVTVMCPPRARWVGSQSRDGGGGEEEQG